MSAPALPGTLTITVLDTATIFEGPDTVYRYDLPGTGIIDGWALQAVVDQAKEICSLHWPDVEIIVDADDAATEVLTRTFLNKGVASYPTEALRETTLPVVPDDGGGEVTITRPTEAAGRGRHRLGRHSWFHPFQLVIAAVVLSIAGLSWWLVGGQDPPEGAGEAVAASAPTPAEETAPETTTATTASTAASTSREPEPPTTVLELAGLSVATPEGFRLEDRDGGLVAVGEDPALRIHLAADPVYSVPAEAVLAQITTMIDTDPTLHPLDPERRAQGDETTRYREVPGDGSEVTWSTWIDDGHQLSVGCQTREEPTIPQAAACRMALDSLRLTGQT